MNPGKIAAVLYDAAFWFFVISVLVLPVVNARWRQRERDDAKKTKKILDSLLHDTTHRYEQDA